MTGYGSSLLGSPGWPRFLGAATGAIDPGDQHMVAGLKSLKLTLIRSPVGSVTQRNRSQPSPIAMRFRSASAKKRPQDGHLPS